MIKKSIKSLCYSSLIIICALEFALSNCFFSNRFDSNSNNSATKRLRRDLNEVSGGRNYGFIIDENKFEVNWKSTKCSAYYDSKKIGLTYIYYGKAIAKEKLSNKYSITYLITVKTCPQNPTYTKNFLWWNYQSTEYGFNSTCELAASLQKGNELYSSAPIYTASNTSYSVGLNFGADSSGANGSISGSVGFEEKAINITNRSSTPNAKIDIGINLNESIWRWDWGRYKYAQQENFQMFSFTVFSDSKYKKQTMTLNTKYGTLDSYANYWSGINNHYASCFATFFI